MPIPHLRIKIPEKEQIRRAATSGLRGVRAFKRKFLTGPRLRAAIGAGILASVFLAIVGVITLAVIFAWLGRTLPDPNNIRARQIAQSTKIFDREGKELLYEIHGEEKRTVVDLAAIPLLAQQATIAVEDKEFYRHKGFRVTSLIRAVLANVLAGRKAQGGSTITQQLVKNAILTNEKSFVRKFKELFLSYEIERRFSKDEILKLYFNEIPYGSNAYGIEAASQTFFGRSAKDVGLVESAMLAALPKAPTRLSPYGTHTDELVARSRLVLDLMADQGYITREQADAAKKEDVLALVQPRRESIKAPHFVLYVKELLTERYGEKTVEQGGLKVVTTLDWKKQQAAEQAVADGMKKVEEYGGSNAALVSLDPKTGQILAMVGSRDYFDMEHDGNVNVTIRPRQPGSSFKPIVYAASFEKGYTPNTVLYDVDTVFHPDGHEYHPRNYDLTEHGPVTVRTALAGSLNIPAVKMLYLTGVGRVLDFAERLGYTTLSDRTRFSLALVLGGAEVRPLEHAASFAAFAADGVTRPTVALLKVEDATGKILDEEKPSEGTRVMDAEVARNLTDILSDNAARAYVFGGQNYLTLPGRPVAAKTGTTNDFRDAWTAGYTPQIATVVWTGNNDNTAMKRGADGSRIAAPIWQQYMKAAHDGLPVEGFVKPQPIATGKPALDGKTDTGTIVRIDRATGLLATELTPPSFVIEKQVSSAHTILYWVDKETPRGPVPTDPASDPEYVGWESAVQAWVKKTASTTPIEDFVPPTEFDTVHSEANRPSVTLLSPSANGTVDGRSVAIAVSASAPRGVSRVEALIDGSLLGVLTNAPWNGSFTLPNRIGRGFHMIEVRAYDDVDNVGSVTVNVNVTAEPTGTPVFWAAPSQGAVLRREQFPTTISASLGSASGISRADFVIVSADGSYRHTAGSTDAPGANIMLAKWMLAPQSGTYLIRLELTKSDGSIEIVPEQVSVTVQ